MKRGNQNTIEDLLNPEVRNILKKYIFYKENFFYYYKKKGGNI